MKKILILLLTLISLNSFSQSRKQVEKAILEKDSTFDASQFSLFSDSEFIEMFKEFLTEPPEPTKEEVELKELQDKIKELEKRIEQLESAEKIETPKEESELLGKFKEYNATYSGDATKIQAKFKKVDLQLIAKELSISTSGTKNTITKRIIENI